MHFNIADLFESVVDVVPDKEALIAGEKRLTYRTLDERANRVAHHLRKQGIGHGDHVGLYLYNSAEFMEIVLGVLKLRAVPININYRYVADELAYMIDNADLKALFFQRELSDVVANVAGRFPALRVKVALEDGTDIDLARSGATSYEEALAASTDVRDFGERSGDDLYIVYTGGTTGMPKGVMWRQEDVFFAGLQGGNPGGPPIKTPEELGTLVKNKPMAMTFMPLAPFIHGAAQWAALIGFFQGGKVVIIPGRSFQPKLVWELVEREKVQTLTMVGDAMARPLVDAHDGTHKTNTLIIIASAGAILSDAVKDELKKKLGSVMILNSFGSSESGHNGHAIPGMDKGKEGRVSFKMDDTAAVFDESTWTRVEKGSGVLGKYARTGRLPMGYYKDEAKTRDTFRELEGKRWVIPGDFATVEPDGRITLYGRGAVCINTGGEKVFPEEVESALKAHPDVMDVLVVGLPDERWGQRVVAVIEARPGATLHFDALDAHVRTHVAAYKCPKQVFACSKVERQPSGKPDYKWALEFAKQSSPIS
jgi:acyl-CoA synthetase (AMP-forming)/AMP-acid ligase II